MPLFALDEVLSFPPPELAEPEGLLAVGGDLSPERLILAYSMGIFPWFNPGDPLLWWSPDPRCILDPGEVHVSRRMARLLRRRTFRVTFDRAYDEVVAGCAEAPREGAEGTWIGPEMIAAYKSLHGLGYGHSVEVWQGSELAGGLYGVVLGRCFFGESMFHRRRDASKVALIHLGARLSALGFELIDCQLPNPHLFSMGAREIPRREFLERLRRAGVTPQAPPVPVDLGGG